MTTHARLSPSSAVRWLNCPAAPLMEHGKPNSRSEYAAEGTAAHHLADQILSFGNHRMADFIGKQIAVSPKGECKLVSDDSWNPPKDWYVFEVDEDMKDYVREYVDLVDNVIQATNGGGFFEQRLPLEQITGEKGATGTADAVIVADNQIIVIDLKYGQGQQIDAENNPQLMMYGLAALNEFDIIGDFDTVRLIISQPRRYHVSEWTIPATELRAWGDNVSNTAKLIDSLDTTSDLTGLFNPSEAACKYCKARAECKALAEHVHEAVCAEFESLDAPLTVSDAKYDSDMLAKMYDRIATIQTWIKAIEEETYAKLMQGEPVGDFKLVQGRGGSRKWLDANEAEATLKAMRIKADAMYNKKLISPTDAEKLNKAGTLGNVQWSKLQDLIVRSEGKPTIAPASDKREAITPNDPVELFDDLTA